MTIHERAAQCVKQWAADHPGYASNIDTDTLINPIESALIAAVEEERERCAKVAENTVRDEWISGIGWQTVTETVAAAIRRLKESP